MCKPHKHAEVIKAWADGKSIEQRNGSDWFVVGSFPTWHNNWEYRIKPEVVKYKRFLWEASAKRKAVLVVTIEEQKVEPRENWCSFIRWIDNDWIEQEV